MTDIETSRPEIPKADQPIHVSAGQKAAEAAVVEAEDAPVLDFGEGMVIHPTELNGLEERRIRLASVGYFVNSQDLYEKMQAGSIEAFGALAWIVRLRATGLTPEQAAKGDPGFTYDSCIEDMTLDEVAEIGERSAIDVDEDEDDSPT